MVSWSKLPRRLRVQVRASPLTPMYHRNHSSTLSHQPPWLHSLLSHNATPPKLFAWTPSNLPGSNASHQSSSPSQRQSQGQGTAHNDLDSRIFIQGLGNLGRLYASYIAKCLEPPPITLVVHRKELLSQWVQGNGIEMTRLGVHSRNKNLDIEWWTETPPEHGLVREVAGGAKIRNLIIATKAPMAMPEVDRLRRYLDSSSTVAFTQNGMCKLWPPHGSAYVTRRFPNGGAPNFLACITTHGVVSEGPFKSLHASPADACVGPVLLSDPSAPSISHLTRQVVAAPLLDSRAVTTPELWILQLEKLVVNSTINPLTAVLRCKNGLLFQEPDGVAVQVMDRLLREASMVLQALIHHESSIDILAPPPQQNGDSSATATGEDHDLDATRQQLTERFSPPRLRAMLHGVGAKVGENTSSMLQDVRAGKSTEIRDFNGWIVDMAAFLDQGLDVSAHQALIGLVERGTVMDKDHLGRYLLT